MNKRILGVDYGHARIGLALSDPRKVIASPLSTIEGSKNPTVAAQKVAAEIQNKKLDIELIIIGLPLHLNGSESERSNEVRAFATALEKLSCLPVRLFDERLTSVQADRLMKSAEMTRKKRASSIDTVSSAILLQCFLDFYSKDALLSPLPSALLAETDGQLGIKGSAVS